MSAKDSLRASIKTRIAHMSNADAVAQSRSVCRRLADSLSRRDVVICAYYPLPDEVDLRPLLRGILKRGDALFLPRFELGSMTFRRTETLDDLTPGAFGIPEPPISADEIQLSEITHVLVPARAYDRSGNRLGRGNGGYDHWITTLRAMNSTVECWGVCFECQLVDAVPMDSHDEVVDAVVTARGFEKSA